MKHIHALAPLLAILCGCPGAQKKNLAIHADLERSVPSGATTLIGVKLTAIAPTEFYRTTVAPLIAPMLAEFSKQSGVDPAKDIDEILIVLRGESEPLLLARGKWDAAALEAKLTANGFQTSSGSAPRIHTRDKLSISFPRAGVIAAGPPAILVDSAKQSGVPPALSPLVDSIGPGAQIWAVSTADFKGFRAPERSNLQNLEKIAASLRTLTAWADVRQGVHLRATGSCATDDDAKQLHGGIRAMMGLARLATPAGQQDLLKALDTVELRQEAAAVRASIDLTAEQFDQLRGMLPVPRTAN